MRTRKIQKRNNRNLFIIVTILAVAILGAILLLRFNTSASQKITPTQYQQQFSTTTTSHVLIDVRTPEEFASGHIPGAINISVQTMPDRLAEIPRDKAIVVYCHTGNRSATASSILSKAGYGQVYDLGGINAWSAAGLPVIQ